MGRFSGTRVAVALMVGALLCLVTWAGAWAWADSGTGIARSALARWETTGSVDDVDTWRRAYALLQAARRINPLDADVSADLGRMHSWQAWAHPVDSPWARRHRGYATRLLQEALARRPTWGYAWAELAEERIMLDGLDARARGALATAVEAGPWERGVLRIVTWVGLTLWDHLDTELRDTVFLSLERIVKLDRDMEYILRVATQSGREDMLLPILPPGWWRAQLEGYAAQR